MNGVLKHGDNVKCIFSQKLPGKDYGPELNHGQIYEVREVYTDGGGNDHIDVGLPLKIEFVKSFATGERLPATTHWCHPNRFAKV